MTKRNQNELNDLTERIVVLKEPNDLTFMGLNIFTHDFLHDFNVVNFSDRLSKISNHIDTLRTAIESRVLQPQPQPQQEGGNDEEIFNFDISDITEEESINEDLFEFDNQNYQKYTTLFRELKFLINKNGVITRSRAALIQKIQNFLYETKLYLIGMIQVKNIKVGGEANIFNYNNSLINLRDKTKSSILMNSEYIKNSKNINVNKIVPYYDNFDNLVQDAFSNTIRQCQEEQKTELANYFTFMAECYLLLKNSKKYPFQTINHPYIEDAVFIYLFTRNKNAENILKTIMTNKQQGGQKKRQKGGALPSLEELRPFKDKIQTSFPQLYEYYLSTKENETQNLTIVKDNLDNIKNKLDEFEIPSSFITTDKTNPSVFIQRKINNLKNEIKNKNSQLNPKARTYENTKLSLIIAIQNYIFDYLYCQIELEIDKQEASETNSNTAPLTQIQRSDVQNISIIVARGGLNYIKPDNLNYNNIEPKNEVLEQELTLLTNIDTKQKVGGKLDENIRIAFGNYAKRIDSSKTTFEEIKSVIEKQNKKVINNAIQKRVFSEIGINEQRDVICPTSSVVDAMGSTGSCSGKTIQNKEFFNMNFRITDMNDVNYYQGQTIIKSENGKPKELKVIFSALFNKFELPNVEINIDITTTTVVTLSANRTFKQVINKILNIWARVFDGQNVSSEEIMWQTLESNILFTDLVSNGAIKSVGDFFQEINSVVEMGGYSDNISNFNNYLRVGVMGDQSSGVRAGYLLLKANSGVNPNSFAGYISPTNGNSVMILSENLSKKQKTVLGGKTTKKKKIQKKTRKIKLRKPY